MVVVVPPPHPWLCLPTLLCQQFSDTFGVPLPMDSAIVLASTAKMFVGEIVEEGGTALAAAHLTSAGW